MFRVDFKIEIRIQKETLIEEILLKVGFKV
jgi:hypothetical protein